MCKESTELIKYDELYKNENIKWAFKKARKRNSFVGADGENCKEIENADLYVSNLVKQLKEYRYIRKPLKYQEILSWDVEKTHRIEMESFSDRIMEYYIQKCLEKRLNIYRMDFVCNAGGKGEKKYKKYIETMREKGVKYFVSYDIAKFTKSVDVSIIVDTLKCWYDDRFIEFLKYILLRDNTKGLPPGHILTTYLSSCYLYSVDIAMKEYQVVRIGDNYVFGIYDLNEKRQIDSKLTSELEKIKMKYNPNKVCILSYEEGVGKM